MLVLLPSAAHLCLHLSSDLHHFHLTTSIFFIHDCLISYVLWSNSIIDCTGGCDPLVTLLWVHITFGSHDEGDRSEDHLVNLPTMSDNPASPLLRSSGGSNGQRPTSKRSIRSTRSKASSTETTPLLSRDEDHDPEDEHTNDDPSSLAASSLRSLSGTHSSKSHKGRRWPSIVALVALTVLVIFIMLAAFFAPAIVEEYASQALVLKPTSISIDSFTTTGVRANINAEFVLDASRVKTDAVRNIGRAGTWLARGIQSEQTTVKVYLPELGNILIGTAEVPGIPVDLRDGHVTFISIMTDLAPGELDDIRRLANDWLEGRIGQLRLQAKADVSLKSGIFPLGTHSVSEYLVFEGQSLYNPSLLSHPSEPIPWTKSDIFTDSGSSRQAKTSPVSLRSSTSPAWSSTRWPCREVERGWRPTPR